MKYKTAKVISHPRAGSHYLAQLLNINFFHLPDYLPLYAGHSRGHKRWLEQSSTAVFYIHRNVEDTVLSMYNLRNRFGLVADSYEEFCNTKLQDMHNENIKSEAIRNIAGRKELITEVDIYLSNINKLPGDYIVDHHIKWITMSNKNFYPVAYESLITFFDDTMLDIAKFLDSDKTEFIKETTRIGWYDKNEPKKIFS